jgi:hypothetical protein
LATITAPAAPAKGPPEYVTRKVGPLMCRFVADRALPDDKRPANCTPIPTVESIAKTARGLMHRIAYYGERKVMLSAAVTRDASERAVNVTHLGDRHGRGFTKAQLAPLVSLVRKQLVANLRVEFRQRDKDERARRLADAKAERAEEKARSVKERSTERNRVREIAKGAKTARCAVLPERTKPTRAAKHGKDAEGPLSCGHLSVTRDGEWTLVTTDSYQICIFPLTVYGDAKLEECMIDDVALKAIERTGAFRFENGQIVPLTFSFVDRWVSYDGPTHQTWMQGVKCAKVPHAAEAGTVRFKPLTGAPLRVNDSGRKDRPRKGQNPAMDMRALPAKSKRMEITFNATLLNTIAAAIAAPDHNGVTISFDADSFKRGEDGVRRWVAEKAKDGPSPAIHVTRRASTDGVRAHLMPIRHDAPTR